MNVLLSISLWLALLMSSCCGAAGSHEEESTTEYYDYSENETEAATPTPDYDYNATFDYYYVTGPYATEDRNKATGIGPFSPLLLLGLAAHQIWN